MKLSFHGAARGVTGSCYLVESAGKRILIDCGLYQGGRELSEENAAPFGFDAKTIDFVLLTHAHLDHCGRLPLLAKRGFQGEIITTAASRELAKVVMLDSAHLQEEDARWQARKLLRKNKKGEIPQPLYTQLDVLNCLDYFGRTAHYNQPVVVAQGITATFLDAGHILGSASIHLQIEDKGKKRSIVFSGDIGNSMRPILRDPTPPPISDVVVMETTYGDRLHKPLEPSIEELYQAIEETFRRGGNVIIPTFALERAQEILFYLRAGIESGRLCRNMQVFLDSPMAISATDIFRRHPECFDAETQFMFASGKDPFSLPGLHFTHEPSESMALNAITGGSVILAGSGMATGGRVRHHLKHNLWRENSSIVFVGFAAQGTLARRIIDGAKTVTLFGEEILVRAKIYTINGFSAHADRDELLTWHQHSRARRTFLVHGDEEVMEKFSAQLFSQSPYTRIERPALGQTFNL
jgi:metallo-beta-lactamase family protein